MKKVGKKYIVSENVINLIESALLDASNDKTSRAIFTLGMLKGLLATDKNALKELDNEEK